MRYSLLGVIILISTLSEALSQIKVIRIENTAAFSRSHTPILFNRSELEKLMGAIPNNQTILVKDQEGHIIPSQCDDLEKDGIWDELVFQYSFNEYETTDFSFQLIPQDSLPSFPLKTNIRLGISPSKDGNFQDASEEVRPKDHLPQSRPMRYQFEGPGWENEQIAFRSYFDNRNGKDIFAKKEPALVLDTIGIPGSNYHLMNSWGTDILKVGNSLGAGALCAFSQKGYIRLGETEQSKFKIITEGPVRSILKLEYKGWDVNNEKINITETITIWAGKYYYESTVELLNTPTSSNVQLGTGIVNIKNKKKKKYKINLNPKYKCLLSYERQSEVNDLLGTAIVFLKEDFEKYDDSASETKSHEEIGNTFLIQFKNYQKPIKFYFFAGWEKASDDFRNLDSFIEHIRSESNSLYIPLSVTNLN